MSFAQPVRRPLSRPAARPVLADLARPLGLPATARLALLVLGGAALTALAAQVSISVPGSPVPVTGQTFAVLLAGAALGPLRGVLSQLLYLALGFVGLPVFTGHGHGLHVISGATGGYLVGFVLAAGLVGRGSRRGADRVVSGELGTFMLATVLIYLCGAGWLAVKLHLGVSTAIAAGVTPFLLGDALKMLLAAGVLPGAWKLVDRVGGGGSTS